ncbi:MAG: CsbD family protein [Alphaproteobacteria bacterium]|nr:CsbD family protein [Alphaproteobacteria bacterium]
MSKEDLHTTWEKIKGAWTQTKGVVKERWGKLTDDDLLEIQGRREKLVGKIQTRYGISHEEAESQVGGWEQKYHSM